MAVACNILVALMLIKVVTEVCFRATLIINLKYLNIPNINLLDENKVGKNLIKIVLLIMMK